MLLETARQGRAETGRPNDPDSFWGILGQFCVIYSHLSTCFSVLGGHLGSKSRFERFSLIFDGFWIDFGRILGRFVDDFLGFSSKMTIL